MKITNLKTCRCGFLRLHVIPILVWLGVIACVVVLFYHRTQRFEVLGIAQGRVHQICAPCDGQLKIVSVGLFEKVSRGQILAMLDNTQLNAQIATIHAEIEHLMSQLLSTQDTMLSEAVNRQTDRIATQRRFYVDVENARVRILEQKTLLETDRMALEDLAVEVKITAELLEKRAIAPYELQKFQALYDALAKKIEVNEALLEQTERDLEETQRRRDEFARHQPQHPSIDSTLDTIRKEISVQEKLIDEILVQRKSLTIKSPIDGVVIQIQVNANQAALRRPGESLLGIPGGVVLAGEPILVVAEAMSKEIITYAREDQLGLVRENMTVELIKNREPAQIAQSQVSYVGPVVEQMPARLWRNPNFPQWGLPILIKIPPGLKLVPGEVVGIRGL